MVAKPAAKCHPNAQNQQQSERARPLAAERAWRGWLVEPLHLQLHRARPPMEVRWMDVELAQENFRIHFLPADEHQ